MNYEKYDDISISLDSLDYKFISSGTKGQLNKRLSSILFQTMKKFII